MDFIDEIERFFSCFSKEEQEEMIKDLDKKAKSHGYTEPKNLLLRDMKPKYKLLELIDEDSGNARMRVIKFDIAKKKYGYRRVLSYMNYDDTKTTSVWIGGVNA